MAVFKTVIFRKVSVYKNWSRSISYRELSFDDNGSTVYKNRTSGFQMRRRQRLLVILLFLLQNARVSQWLGP